MILLPAPSRGSFFLGANPTPQVPALVSGFFCHIHWGCASSSLIKSWETWGSVPPASLRTWEPWELHHL